MRNVPSFVGLIPHEWTEAVIRKLRQYAIQNEVIREAFRITRSNKMDFEAPFGYSMAELKLIFPARPESPVSRQVRDTAPSLGQVHPSQWTDYGVRQALSQMEAQYVKAMLNGDTGGMEAIAVSVLGLIWQAIKAKLADRKLKNEVAFTQEWDNIVNEAFQNAPNLRGNVLRLTRADIRQMQSWRNPGDMEFGRIVRLRIPRGTRASEGEGEGEAD